MRYLSVCSGIEAATCAWHPLDWEPVAFSEIDRFPSLVLKHHYPHVPNLGDMTKFKDWKLNGPIDLLVGGTPCQSFSVAGLRKGLDDPRGNLMLTYLAIAERFKPRWVVWENVPGVFSATSHSAPDPVPPPPPVDMELDGQEVETGDDYTSEEVHAFQCLLAGFSELGYGTAYRVLDAQYAGVPQRRRRVFVVGYLGDQRRAAAVLFERHSMSGNPAPSRETRQDVAGTLGSCSTAGGGFGTDFELEGGFNQSVANSLRAQAQASHRADSENYVPVVRAFGGNNQAGEIDVATARNASASASASASGRMDFESETFIVNETVSTLDASFGKLRGCSGQDANHGHSHLVPMLAHALRADGFDASEDGTGRDTPIVPIAFDCKASGQNGFGVGEIASTMRSMGHNNSHQNGGGHIAVATAMQVRRLTPMECERLQGFPDGYTDILIKGKPAADGPRYKALGNSMAVPVMRWIGERIQLLEDLVP